MTEKPDDVFREALRVMQESDGLKVRVKKHVHLIMLTPTEPMWKSIASDAFTWLVVVGVIGVGWLLNSNAMQWAGFGLLCVAALGLTNKGKKLTITEARAELDRIESGKDAPST